jgi:serine/threonine protein kinase
MITTTTTNTIMGGESSYKGTIRWMAPELHATELGDYNEQPTKESDIYALGVTFWEVSLPTNVSDHCMIFNFLPLLLDVLFNFALSDQQRHTNSQFGGHAKTAATAAR